MREFAKSWRAKLDIRTSPEVMELRLRWVQLILGGVIFFYLIESVLNSYEVAMHVNVLAGVFLLAVEYVRSRLRKVGLACWMTVVMSILILSATALIDGQGDSPTLWFISVVPVMGGQLLGNRAVLVAAAASFFAVGAVMSSGVWFDIHPEYPESKEALVVLRMTVLLVCCGVSLAAKRTSMLQMDQLDSQARELIERRLECDGARRSASVFLASMSGHIREPMDQLVQRTKRFKELAPRHSADLALDAEHCALRLTRLVHDILDLSDLENERFELHPTTFGLFDFADTLDAWFERQGHASLDLEIELPSQDLRLTLDKERLHQICTRLLENAIRFSRAKHLRISMDVSLIEEDASETPRLVLRVIDDGVGIPPDLKKQVMERFAFYCDTHATQDKGAGLSLVLLRRLAQRMGGDISFEEQSAQCGTCILVQLHAKISECAEAALAA